MSLDDYLQDIDIANFTELKTAIKIYHKKEKVFLFNTYDYYDYVIQILERNKNIKDMNDLYSFLNNNNVYLNFDLIVKGLSKDTFIIFDDILFEDLMNDYFKFINKKGA